MARLLGVFVAASLYLVAVYHLTNLYFARQSAFEAFILLGRGDGGVYPVLFWGGYVLVGALLPMLLLFHPRWRGPNAHAGGRGAGGGRAPSRCCSSSSSAGRRSRWRSSPATR